MNEQLIAELEHARALLSRIEAMVRGSYWNSHMRGNIGDCAQKAALHLKNAEQCPQPSTPTSSSSAGS